MSCWQFLLEHLDYDDDNFKTVLVCLGQVAKLHPLVFTTKDKQVIANFIMEEIIVKDRVCVFQVLAFICLFVCWEGGREGFWLFLFFCVVLVVVFGQTVLSRNKNYSDNFILEEKCKPKKSHMIVTVRKDA